MLAAPLPDNEPQRLRALHQYQILDTPAENSFDDLTYLAAEICQSPVAVISLVDAQRQWFKSKVGLTATETPRSIAFCAHAILQPEQLFVIHDTLDDQRFATNALVTSTPYIRFYAGAPLVTSDGYALGTLCVIDTIPRQLSQEQQEALRALARQVVTQLELRRNFTRLKLAEDQLIHHAFHDELTNLPNRALFMNRLEQVIARHKRCENFLFAVLFLDLDRFKVINDSLGHLVGDQLLQGIARRLEMCMQPGDMIARLGGDEFAILLSELRDISDANYVAECIQKQLALPFTLSGQEVFTSTSIGMALSTVGYEQPEDLLRDSDIAMYHAKGLGKACYQVFSSAMHTHAVELLQLETDLRDAVEHQKFQLYYQPIVSLQTDSLVGFETLLRWQHPIRGFISPAEFIPLAEETGLIIPLGFEILRQACRQMQAWQTKFPASSPLTISVNISGKQFSQPDFIHQLQQILQDTGLDARFLKLELTESVIMENVEAATNTFRQLKELGVQLHMDDFGTGYSSLSYLHRFPIDQLKIDRSFIARMLVEPEDLEIVRTIIALAHNLRMTVTAEGVETLEQLLLLKELGCEYGQGYYFSQPVDALAVDKLLVNKRLFKPLLQSSYVLSKFNHFVSWLPCGLSRVFSALSVDAAGF